MKVCTDACIFGAWFAHKVPKYSLILDAGSGTGLLMFMLAQKTKSEIHGVEIDFDAYKQSKSNIAQNGLADRLRVYPGDLREYSFQDKYDFIISNPPFFDQSLVSADARKNLAKHSSQLTLEQLLTAIERNLKPTGSFGILLPFDRAMYFEKLANDRRYFVHEKILVAQTPEHKHFRAILHLSRTRFNDPQSYDLVISDNSGDYTSDFVELLQDYYPNL
ncbi:MAG TPA: methyltransferase [Puia sp.]|nr:methyltransferase [Puia sp.]